MSGSPGRPTAPSGASTLTELVAAAERDGYTDQFDAVLDDSGEAHLVCCGGRVTVRPQDVVVAWAGRTEGASDPADEMYVAAIDVPSLGAKGVYIAAYGPLAGAADAALLPDLPQPRPPVGR